MEIH
jgi:hypothetical protein